MQTATAAVRLELSCSVNTSAGSSVAFALAKLSSDQSHETTVLPPWTAYRAPSDRQRTHADVKAVAAPGREIQLRAQLCDDTWKTRTACDVVTSSASRDPQEAPTTASPPTSREDADVSTIVSRTPRSGTESG